MPLDLLDHLDPDERLLAEDMLIEALHKMDTWPVRGLGYLRSAKALPALYVLLDKWQLAMKINVAFAIYQINRDNGMVEVVLDEFPKINDEFALIDTFYLLPIFQDPRITALLERYTHDKRYLVVYNAARALGRPTDEVVKEFRKKGKPKSWWQRWRKG
ncbi:MAG TPA: hypothetical protein VHD83_00400 [Puia sp.]|nr:hypothetical protein [Puia sp.]